jgi:hypothetical protein
MPTSYSRWPVRWGTPTGDIDDLVALVDHQRHSVTLELIGERAPRSHQLLLHHRHGYLLFEVTGQVGDPQL